MSKNVVIVESPAKAKTINKFLGPDYEVKACMGHVRDLPSKSLGIDIENEFAPTYQIIPNKKDCIKELQKAIKNADCVYLATDLDREGEAIAWHLSEALKIPEEQAFRVIFNEITKNAIKEAFLNPTKISIDKVEAQQARRILDRLVGYKLSPLLWDKITRGLSAGRVQSVAVMLIVQREKEISSFVPEEYWKIVAKLAKSEKDTAFDAELKKADGKNITLPNEKGALEILEEIKGKPFIVSEVKRNTKEEWAPPPFITSQLQQQASVRLKLSTKKTMSIAQELYEGLDVGTEGRVGLITYMRTDSFQVSKEAIEDCRGYIGKHFDKEYLPSAPNMHENKKTSQGAHEAIRPTSCERTPESIKGFLSKDQYRLYKLIWERFLASQMTPARYASTTVHINVSRFLFEAKGRETLFIGHSIFSVNIDDEDSKKDEALPPLSPGDKLEVLEIKPTQHFTQPPPRYTEATLVKILEAKGIGRPSTYAPIISTIQSRGYVKLVTRKFHATELGIKVTERLVKHFPKIMDVGFTSDMETHLDQIEDGHIQWVQVLKEFYNVFEKSLDKAYEEMESLKENPEISEYSCPKCGKPMVYKYNRQGKFLGCSGFPECKATLSIDNEGKPFISEKTEIMCTKCGKPMVTQLGRKGKFLGCSGFPECKNTIALSSDGEPIIPKETDISCEKCGSPMVIRNGRLGNFLACTGYPKCKNTKSVDKDGKVIPKLSVDEKCDKCGSPMVVKYSRGRRPFLGCSGYPNCKNIKSFGGKPASS